MREEELETFENDELTADDLAILDAFDAVEDWDTKPTAGEQKTTTQVDTNDEDMLQLFIVEVKEDLRHLQRVLQQLNKEDVLQVERFRPIQRASHKIRGTAGAMNFDSMSTVAGHIEIISEQVGQQMIEPQVALTAINPASQVLEYCLQTVISAQPEQDMEALLKELERLYQSLGINIYQEIPPAKASTKTPTSALPEEIPEPATPSSSFVRVDATRLQHLTQHMEQLIEHRTPLQNAKLQVEKALRELQSAQERLAHYETYLTHLLQQERVVQKGETEFSSSLITRILQMADGETVQPRKPTSRARPLLPINTEWDELNMEHYTEKDMLLRSLQEAIADVTMCSTNLQAAYAQMNRVQQESIAKIALVRSEIQLLRLTPLRALIPQLRTEIMQSSYARENALQFDVVGEDIEIDQDILALLTMPLQQILRICIMDTNTDLEQSAFPKETTPRIWFHAHAVGSNIVIELGFSMTVQGGAIEAIREPLQRLQGIITLQRNTHNGISFILKVPRAQGPARCLLVRASRQHFLIPIGQIQRVADHTRESVDILYRLHDLLGFPPIEGRTPHIQPMLILQVASRTTVGILIDEVLDENDFIVKPLNAYLQRPGIIGATTDGQGNAFLLLDAPTLVRHYHQQPPSMKETKETTKHYQHKQVKVLLADDSVSHRHAVLQTLKKKNYEIMEARDGLEALEQLLETVPDIFLLDIEMPNLNGFDLLDIMRIYPEWSQVKIIMLTSRSSDVHIKRAFELGAHAYLNKPCGEEKLLATIETFLKHNG